MNSPTRVLVTRPAKQSEKLVERLNGLGYNAQALPLMQIDEIQSELPASIADTLVFVSANAASFGIAQLQHLGVDLVNKRLISIGPATAAALQVLGLNSEVPEKGFRSEELLQMFAAESNLPDAVTLVCGRGGREYLQQGLGNMGVQVNRLEVYRRSPVEGIESALQDLEKTFAPQLISLMNQESLKLFDKALNTANLPQWKRIPVLVTSQRVQQSAKNLAFLQVFCQKDPTESSLIDFLTQFSPQ